MAEIITTLHPDNDSNTNLYPNIKKENIPNKSISTDKLDDNVLSLIGSLKPSGTDTSTNILAYTSNKGIYVATDNGHWYYWNGNKYADGGVYQSSEDINQIKNEIANLEEDYYTHNTNNNYSYARGIIYSTGKWGSGDNKYVAFAASDFVKVKKGSKIGVDSNIYACNCAEYSEPKDTTLIKFHSMSSNTITIENDCYIRSSIGYADGRSLGDERSSDIGSHYVLDFLENTRDIQNGKIEQLEKSAEQEYCDDFLSLFHNVVCIGDSLTRGYYAEEDEGQRNRDYGYPSALSRMTRLNVYNYGLSGATPTSWFNGYMSSGTRDFSIFDCAIICLGRNGSLTLNEDVTGYKNIISKLLEFNPNMTIFCLSLPPSNNGENIDNDINNKIKDITIEMNVNYVDIYNNSYCKDSKYRSDGTHFYTLGYMLLAKTIKDNIERYIYNNENKFMQLWVPITNNSPFRAELVE